MPINWNEVDKTRLEYIQKRAIAEANYQAYLNKRDNKSFLYRLFNPLKAPEGLSDYNTFSLYKNYFYYLNIPNKDKIEIANLLSLPSELKNNIMKYLSPNEGIHVICDREEEFLYVDDNEENRKRLDKVVTLIEKYLDNEKAAQEARQKEAEAFIDNYINNKDTK